MDEEEFKTKEAIQALEEATQQLKELQGLHEKSKLEGALNHTAEPPLCSFCGKGINQVRRMIEGQHGHICDGCVRECLGLIQRP
jgi:hypothetical protein